MTSQRTNLTTEKEDYRLWGNQERTVLVRVWNTGEVEVCTREDSAGIWGPPVCVEEESR